jgi:hypothetical protein
MTLPNIENYIHAAGARIADLLNKMGYTVTSVSNSVNRHGGSSCYIKIEELGPIRFRISDHTANQYFRIGEISIVDDADEAYLNDVFANLDRNAKTSADQRAQQDAKRDAREAPFKARFLAAPHHERHGILVECYAWAASDKAARKEIWARWTGLKSSSPSISARISP